VTGRVFTSSSPPPVGVALTDDMRREIRWAAVLRYARLRRDGQKPIRCSPPQSFVAAMKARGIHCRSKIIFDTPEDAADFAAVCEAVGGEPQSAYTCQWSPNRGHLHLRRSGEPDPGVA
jgi:hypothetical protein